MEDISLPIPDDNRILFFERDREIFGFMSNFHEVPITIEGEVWQSTEFYYQAQKSDDPEYRAAIRAATNPLQAKRLGTDPRATKKWKKRSWFLGREDRMRPDWNGLKVAVMETIVRAKFGQNPRLMAMLLATGDAEIIEDSTHDPFWGIGLDNQGQNQMGKVLMKVRQELREQSITVCTRIEPQ